MMNGLAELDQLIRANDVTMELEKVATNPILAASSEEEGLEHYRCELLRPGERMDVYLSLRAEDGPPALMDVLFMLALDASGCDMLAGFEKYRDKWYGFFGDSSGKPKEMEFFWEELEGRCRQTERFEDFLGPSAYGKLINFMGLGEDDDLNPSAGTLMVPSTSASTPLLSPSPEDVQEH